MPQINHIKKIFVFEDFDTKCMVISDSVYKARKVFIENLKKLKNRREEYFWVENFEIELTNYRGYIGTIICSYYSKYYTPAFEFIDKYNVYQMEYKEDSII